MKIQEPFKTEVKYKAFGFMSHKYLSIHDQLCLSS